MPNNVLIGQPTTSGTMPDAFPQYRALGAGFTDRVLLLGHGPLVLNDIYQVTDIRQAVNDLGADSNCPLLRGLLELYYGGARDIFLMAVAPMSELIDEPLRDHTWYTTYSNRLNVTYDILLDYDLPQIIVPLNAPYFDAKGVDFLTPLANHCGRAFDQATSDNNATNSGDIRMGIIGTSTGLMGDTEVSIMSTDTRLSNLGDDGKFVSVVVGSGIVNIKEMPAMYTSALAASAAAELSQLPYNRSLTWTKLRNILNLNTRFSPTQTDQLTQAKLNPVVLTTLGARGQSFQTVIMTDNTLGLDGSDYWSIVQVRLAMYIIDSVRAMGRRYLGTIGFGQFKQDVQNFFLTLKSSSFVKDCSINVARDDIDPNTVNVDISFTPFFGLRQISFTVNVGPAN